MKRISTAFVIAASTCGIAFENMNAVHATPSSPRIISSSDSSHEFTSPSAPCAFTDESMNLSTVGDFDVIHAINVGGGNYMTSDGTSYLSDRYYSPYGTTYSVPDSVSIAKTDDDKLYRSERNQREGFSYALPVDNGTYVVTMKFAEIHFSMAGERVLDLYVENTPISEELDLWSSACKNVAFDISVVTKITDGIIDLNLLPIRRSPKLSAILVQQ